MTLEALRGVDPLIVFAVIVALCLIGLGLMSVDEPMPPDDPNRPSGKAW